MGGGISNSQIVTEEGIKSLDAVQNNPSVEGSLRQGLNIANEQIANLFKIVQATGTLTGNVDWNNYKDAGVYKVQDAVMTAENHVPVGMPRFGVLIVIVAETGGEYRTVQIYFPDNEISETPIAIRTFNNNSWRKWRVIQGTILG